MKPNKKLPVERILPMLDADVAEDVREMIEGVDSACYQRKAVVEKTTVNADERSVVRYISTRDVDRDGEILVPEGAEIKEYLKNPVVLFGHNYSEPPHAKAEWVRRDQYGLKSKTVYADTERGEEIWKLIEGGFLNAASVGFITLDAVANGANGWKETVAELAQKWDMKPKEFEGVRGIITKWLLLEYSDVPVPSNGNALVQRSKELGISDELIRTLGLEPLPPEPVIEVKPVVECWVRPVTQIYAAPVRPALDVRAVAEKVIREKVLGCR